MFSCELCKMFKNTFFYRTPPVAASDWTLRFQKSSLKMVRAWSLLTLKMSLVKICRFLLRIATYLSVSKNFSKDDVSRLYTMRRYLSCKFYYSLYSFETFIIKSKKWDIKSDFINMCLFLNHVRQYSGENKCSLSFSL